MQTTYQESMAVVMSGKVETIKNKVELYATRKIVDIPADKIRDEKFHLIGLYRSENKPSGTNSHWFIAPIPYTGSKVWITAIEAAKWTMHPDSHMCQDKMT